MPASHKSQSPRQEPPERDERTIAVENASYRLGYLLAMFALLLAVARRSFFLKDPAWDLLGIVIGSGLAVQLYQWRARILGKAHFTAALLAVVGGGLVALLVASLAGGLLR